MRLVGHLHGAAPVDDEGGGVSVRRLRDTYTMPERRATHVAAIGTVGAAPVGPPIEPCSNMTGWRVQAAVSKNACMWATLAPYLGLCLLITITPGLDTAVVTRNVVRRGTQAGMWTALGCALGLFAHAIAVALGLASLLLRSATAFEVVKVAGAAFLILLGLRSPWAARRAAPVLSIDATTSSSRESLLPILTAPFTQGLMTNLTNPKATLFFLATLPQFVPANRPGAAMLVALGLAVIAVLFSLSGLSLIALTLGKVRRWLDSSRFRQVQEGLLGATLVALRGPDCSRVASSENAQYHAHAGTVSPLTRAARSP